MMRGGVSPLGHGMHWLRRLTDYHNVNYGQLADAIRDLATNYPDFVDVKTAQDAYGLQSPGTCTDSGGASTPCLQYIVTVTDKASLPDPERAEVFLSGEVHGNERIGPPAVLATITLLAKAAKCIKENCTDSGMPAVTVEWLASLVRSRVVVAMPMTNALGYSQNTREEGPQHLDPNRDFPFMQDPKHCMTTITARSLNEVWREHLFQLALTFHAGMESITYEWGSPNHMDKEGSSKVVSPDDTAQDQIATVLSQYAGRFPGTPDYQHGITNTIVYPVEGGMEDWAYGGSWDKPVNLSDPPVVQPCKPETYGGYAEEKTIYNNVTLRAFNILVETSNNKQPDEPVLGSDVDLWEASGEGTGHVTRNVRLALALIDLAQPYVSWVDQASSSSCLTSCEPSALKITESNGDVQLPELLWRVGGAINVDETQLMWGPWPSSSPSHRHLSSTTPTPTTSDFSEASEAGVCGLCKGSRLAVSSSGRTDVQNGHSRWVKDEGGKRQLVDQQEKIPGLSDPVFSASLTDAEALKTLRDGKDIFVVARARVDQDWKENRPHHPADLPPQSHVVNARTNPEWYAESNGHVIRGRTDWYSHPLRLTLGNPTSSRTASTPGPDTDTTSTTPDTPTSDTHAASPLNHAETTSSVVGSGKSDGTTSGTETPYTANGIPGVRIPQDRTASPSLHTMLKGFGVTVGMVTLLGVFLAVVYRVRSRIRTRRTGPMRGRPTYTPIVTSESKDVDVELAVMEGAGDERERGGSEQRVGRGGSGGPRGFTV